MTDYSSSAFFGRDLITDMIVGYLTNPDADEQRTRSIMVEAPAGRGKTWLLYHIADRLHGAGAPQEPGAHPPIVALLRADTDFKDVPQGDARWRAVIGKLVKAYLEHRAGTAPRAPFNDLAADSDELTIETTLARFSTSSILGALAEQIEDAQVQYILIVDGLEDSHFDICADFEINILSPFFRSKQVRVLASRRSGNPAVGWQHRHNVRIQTVPIELGGFDDDETGRGVPDPPDDPPPLHPHEQQVDYLVQASNGSLSQAAVEQWRADLLRSGAKHYGWSNPGVNVCLVEQALKQGVKQIAAAHIRTCLDTKLRPASGGPQQLGQGWSEHNRALRRLVQHLGSNGARPIGRPEVAQLLGLEFAKTSELLSTLQNCGIGMSERSGTFKVHPEFVQLIGWLNQLEPGF